MVGLTGLKIRFLFVNPRRVQGRNNRERLTNLATMTFVWVAELVPLET